MRLTLSIEHSKYLFLLISTAQKAQQSSLLDIVAPISLMFTGSETPVEVHGYRAFRNRKQVRPCLISEKS